MRFVASFRDTTSCQLARLLVCLWCITGLFSTLPLNAAVWKVTYPKTINHDSMHDQYVIEILELALQKTGVRYQLVQTEDILLQQKSIKLLSDNREIDIMWSMTDTDRENLLQPIRIPLYKGLIGWRVLLMHKDNEQRFANLRRPDLNAFSMVQGMDWPDSKILRSNGFTVINATDHNEAFAILAKQQADFFPRSVIEVMNELAQYEGQYPLVLEPNFVIEYPSATYFFLNKNNTVLYKLISKGLKMAVADGSLQALFDKTYGSILDDLGIADRILLQLDNPLLPKQTPVNNPLLWHQQY